ncbi:MAG: DNA internalization-related competence protein ComEC/Rec2 [Oscillospiraceae bacterium]
MGKLVWAAIGFAAAAFGAEYFLPIAGLPYFAAALAVITPAAKRLNKKYRAAVMTVLLSAVLGLLSWWGCYALHVAPCEELAGQDVTITARVTDYPQVTEQYSRVTVRIMDGAPQERANLYLYDADLPELRPGDIIAAAIRVRPVMDRSAAEMHTNTSSGVYLRGYFRGEIQVVGQWRYAGLYFPKEFAQYVKNTCESLFPGRLGVFMKALLTGDKQDLYGDVELYGDMRASGVLHIVTVSGMHVFILLVFAELLFGRQRWVRLLYLPLIGVFVLMTGAGAAVVRAAIMHTLYIGAPVVGRERDELSAISAALLLELLVNPMAVGGVGLQLSYACALGLALFLPRLLEATKRPALTRRRLVRYLRDSVVTSISATVLSIPLSAYYFGTVSLLAIPANVLLIPAAELCFAGGYVVCAVNALFPALARLGAWMLSWGVRWCTLVVRLLGRLPFSCLYTAHPGTVLWLVFAYGLLLWYLICRYRRRYLHPGIPLGLGFIGLCLVFLWSFGSRLISGQSTVAVLDVGQGQCVEVYDSTSAVVIDCGGSGLTNAGNIAADRLWSAGIRRVDALVLTHLHEDHTNGVETLLYRIPVKRLYLPANADDGDEMLPRLMEAASRYGTEVVFLSGDVILTLDELRLTLVLPQADSDANERGIVVLAEYPEQSALIMGDAGTDAELALLEKGFAPDVDILVVGHHGSKTASGALFLRAIRAETSVISVGEGNSYGLPAEEILERLENYTDEIYRTDTEGAVIFRGNDP